MAIKFSQFSSKTTVADIDFLVGYKSTDNIQIPIGLVTVNTTYSVATAQDGANETLTLTGAGPASTDVITFTAGADISLTDDGAGNGFTIAGTGPQGTVTSIDYTSDITALTAAGGPITTSGTLTLNKNGGTAGQYIDGAAGAWTTLPASTNTTYTVDVPTGTTSINLKSSDAVDDAIVLVGGTDIGLVRDSANQITINSQAVGGVTSVDETTPGISAGTPIVVNPTTGTVLVQSMAFDGAAKVGHVPSSAAAGQTTHFLRADGTWQIVGGTPVKTVNTFNISGTSTNTLIVTSPTNPSTVNFIDVYINGVYQAKANATLAVKTLTLAAGFYPDGAIIETVTTT